MREGGRERQRQEVGEIKGRNKDSETEVEEGETERRDSPGKKMDGQRWRQNERWGDRKIDKERQRWWTQGETEMRVTEMGLGRQRLREEQGYRDRERYTWGDRDGERNRSSKWQRWGKQRQR